MIPELEIKRLRQEMQDGFKRVEAMLAGRGVIGNWVKQNVACQMLEVQPRRLRDLRIHMEGGKKVGFIRWRAGKGRTREYHKADIEALLNSVTVA